MDTDLRSRQVRSGNWKLDVCGPEVFIRYRQVLPEASPKPGTSRQTLRSAARDLDWTRRTATVRYRKLMRRLRHPRARHWHW